MNRIVRKYDNDEQFHAFPWLYTRLICIIYELWNAQWKWLFAYYNINMMDGVKQNIERQKVDTIIAYFLQSWFH